MAPKHTEQDRRRSEAAPEGLAELRRETSAKPQAERAGSLSREGRPQGCRSAGGRQSAGLASAAWQPKDPGGRNKTRGAGPRQRRGPGGAKKRWILFAKPKTNHRWPQQSIFRNKFCAAGSGISFRRRRPDGLWSRGARPAGACGTA